MPVMPRPKGKATKIAYKILGKPLNMQKQNQIKDSKLQKRLLFEDTERVR
jgi:hypothetical protein